MGGALTGCGAVVSRDGLFIGGVRVDAELAGGGPACGRASPWPGSLAPAGFMGDPVVGCVLTGGALIGGALTGGALTECAAVPGALTWSGMVGGALTGGAPAEDGLTAAKPAGGAPPDGPLT
ncbi:hypothetical protein AB0M37_24970 [Micromonospora chalcea]